MNTMKDALLDAGLIKPVAPGSDKTYVPGLRRQLRDEAKAKSGLVKLHDAKITKTNTKVVGNRLVPTR